MPTGVNINRFAEMFHRHGGTLNMPPGSTLTPRAIPPRFLCLRFFPEIEIPADLPSVHQSQHEAPGKQILRLTMRELSIFRKVVDAVIYVSINFVS